jgi:hypothetical protein
VDDLREKPIDAKVRRGKRSAARCAMRVPGIVAVNVVGLRQVKRLTRDSDGGVIQRHLTATGHVQQ